MTHKMRRLAAVAGARGRLGARAVRGPRRRAPGRRPAGRHGLHPGHRAPAPPTRSTSSPRPATSRRPDGNSVFMWSYANADAPDNGHFQSPGPVLCVDPGRDRRRQPDEHTCPRPRRSCSRARKRVTRPAGRGPADERGGGHRRHGELHVRRRQPRHLPLRERLRRRQAGRDGPVRRADRPADRRRRFAYDAATQFDPSREYLLLLAEIDPDLHHAVETGATYDFNALRQPLLHDQRPRVPGHDPGQRLGPAAQPAVRRARPDPAEHRDQHAAGPDPDDQRRRGQPPVPPARQPHDADRPGRAAAQPGGARAPSTSARPSAPARRRTSCCAGTTTDHWNPVTNPFRSAAELPGRDVQGRQHLVQRQPVPRLQGHAARPARSARTSAVSGTSRSTATR